ncbi:MAG: hypothetical protein ABWX67_11475 [Allosphingosinicella sp.]
MRHSRIVLIAAALAAVTTLPAFAATEPVSDRERFEAEQTHRDRQQALAESEQALRKADLDLRRAEQDRSRWTSPLVLAIVAAAIAALGNAVVAFVNGRQQRELERDRAEANRALEREKAENQLKLERDKAQAQLRLDGRKAESDRILEVIKTGESEAAAANLQFLLSSGLVGSSGLGKRLAAYLATRQPGSGPSLPAADGRFRFEPGAAPSEAAAMETALRAFCGYLEQVGFKLPEAEVSIAFEGDNASYDQDRQRVIIGAPLRSEPFAAYREYMHHVLTQFPNAPPFGNVGANSIQSGLADYFPASFMDTPLLGANGARAMKLDRPYLRTLTGTAGFADLGSEMRDVWLANGQIWGSLFWDIRDSVGQATTDHLLLEAWTQVRWPVASDKAPAAFLQRLIDTAVIQDADVVIGEKLRKRGFVVPRAKARRIMSR